MSIERIDSGTNCLLTRNKMFWERERASSSGSEASLLMGVQVVNVMDLCSFKCHSKATKRLGTLWIAQSTSQFSQNRTRLSAMIDRQAQAEDGLKGIFRGRNEMFAPVPQTYWLLRRVSDNFIIWCLEVKVRRQWIARILEPKGNSFQNHNTNFMYNIHVNLRRDRG